MKIVISNEIGYEGYVANCSECKISSGVMPDIPATYAFINRHLVEYHGLTKSRLNELMLYLNNANDRIVT